MGSGNFNYDPNQVWTSGSAGNNGNWTTTTTTAGGSFVGYAQVNSLSECCNEPAVDNGGKMYCSGCNKEFYQPKDIDWREYERIKLELEAFKKAQLNSQVNAINYNTQTLNNGTIQSSTQAPTSKPNPNSTGMGNRYGQNSY